MVVVVRFSSSDTLIYANEVESLYLYSRLDSRTEYITIRFIDGVEPEQLTVQLSTLTDRESFKRLRRNLQRARDARWQRVDEAISLAAA